MINWYADPRWWPVIFVFLNVWKSLGYNSIIYYASVMGIDPTYYEADDGRWCQQMATNKNVTIPQNFTNDVCFINFKHRRYLQSRLWFVLHRYQEIQVRFYNVTSVLDTYIYNGLTATGDVGMTALQLLYQSVVGGMFIINCEFSCSSN